MALDCYCECFSQNLLPIDLKIFEWNPKDFYSPDFCPKFCFHSFSNARLNIDRILLSAVTNRTAKNSFVSVLNQCSCDYRIFCRGIRRVLQSDFNAPSGYIIVNNDIVYAANNKNKW